MLSLFRAPRDFVVLSLDGSRQVTETLEEDKSVTVDSQLDHYCARPDVPEFREVSLLKFVQNPQENWQCTGAKEQRCNSDTTSFLLTRSTRTTI